MGFWAGWMLRGMVAERPTPADAPPETAPLTLLELALWPFAFAVKLMAALALLGVVLAVGGVWAQGLLMLSQWVMDGVGTYARLYPWGVGKRALYVVTPGLVAMALYWAISVFIVGGIWRGLWHVVERRAARRQVRALLRHAKEEIRGDGQ